MSIKLLNKDLMNIGIITRMVYNSDWRNVYDNRIFKFIDGNHISINGKLPLSYSIKFAKNKMVIHIGDKMKYFVEYIDDFTLFLYNECEKFKIRLD